MNAFFKTAVVAAVLATSSMSFAATISCQGQSANGTDVIFKHTTLADGSVKVFIRETQDGEIIFRNSWTSDQSNRTNRVNGVMIQDNNGDRGEFYSRVSVTGHRGDVLYEENDSGWEYSILLSQVKCETK